MRNIELLDTSKLMHIEGFSKKRVVWLKNKILQENCWTTPLRVEKDMFLVMDGQHRMEVAILMGLRKVPCLLYSYDEVSVWSLRDQYIVNPEVIKERVITNNLYPYKTAKHAFPDKENFSCSFSLEQLK